jgi:hypothetical protein
VADQPAAVPSRRRATVALGDWRRRLHTWQDRIRDPSLTATLILQLCAIFVAAPLAARGLSIAQPILDTLVLAVLVVVVLLSHRRGAIVVIMLGLAATLTGGPLGPERAPLIVNGLRHGGTIVTFSTLTWVVLHAVYAPGRITLQRLQGAAVVYLNLASIFASAFAMIWDLNPAAFANLPASNGNPGQFAVMLYFSLTTLTTTGYGDIVPIDPFARSLANLESVLGQFYLAITVARLVTLELADRRR